MTGLNATVGVLLILAIGAVTAKIVSMGKEPLPEKYRYGQTKHAELPVDKSPATELSHQASPSPTETIAASDMEPTASLPTPGPAPELSKVDKLKLLLEAPEIQGLAKIMVVDCIENDICVVQVEVYSLEAIPTLHIRMSDLVKANPWLAGKTTHEVLGRHIEYLFVKKS